MGQQDWRIKAREKLSKSRETDTISYFPKEKRKQKSEKIESETMLMFQGIWEGN